MGYEAAELEQREVGDLTLANPLYRANLKTLEAQDEMLGTLLDVVR